eukprot:gene2692-1690_t
MHMECLVTAVNVVVILIHQCMCTCGYMFLLDEMYFRFMRFICFVVIIGIYLSTDAYNCTIGGGLCLGIIFVCFICGLGLLLLGGGYNLGVSLLNLELVMLDLRYDTCICLVVITYIVTGIVILLVMRRSGTCYIVLTDSVWVLLRIEGVYLGYLQGFVDLCWIVAIDAFLLTRWLWMMGVSELLL